jgi:hypothetical protein
MTQDFSVREEERFTSDHHIPPTIRTNKKWFAAVRKAVDLPKVLVYYLTSTLVY